FGKREVRRQQSAMRAARQAGSAKFRSITTRGRLGHSEVRTNFRERQAALLGEQAKNGAVTFRSEHATVEAGVRCLTNGNAHNRSNRARAIARVLGFVLLRGSRVIRFADGWAAIAARGGGGQGDPRHVPDGFRETQSRDGRAVEGVPDFPGLPAGVSGYDRPSDRPASHRGIRSAASRGPEREQVLRNDGPCELDLLGVPQDAAADREGSDG